MDTYEATKLVFQRIQNLDPQNASIIMGFLLIQDHGEKEMIRLAFGPETLVQSVIVKARKELSLASSNMPSTPVTPSPSPSPSPSPFTNPLTLSKQNSSSSSASSRLIGGVNLPSPLCIPNPSSTAPSSWTNSSSFSDCQPSDELISPSGYINCSATSTICSVAAPFYASGEVDLIDELQLQDQLSFLNDGASSLGQKISDFFYHQQQDLAASPTGNDPYLYPCSPAAWGGSAAVNGLQHRRSCSVSDVCVGSDDLSGGFGWKPCLFYARGYCKNGNSCRFVHGEGGVAADAGASVGSPNNFEMMEQCQEMLRLKSSQQQRLAADSHLLASTNFAYPPVQPNKCMSFFLQQQLSPDSQRALMMGDGIHKFSRPRFERGDFGINCVNPGSRQIYLTFPADSTFKEDDVSNYFSNFGPVQDVRIPYQQKRMFGFVTFDYPETVKLILAKGNPHFVCDARVLVKPYKEKGKTPDKPRKQQQQMERGEFTGCGTGSLTGLEPRDPYVLPFGSRMFSNSQEMLWRRKLEGQSDLQQAIELQNRRLMNLQFLDIKQNSHHRAHSIGSAISPQIYSPFLSQSVASSNHSSSEAKEDNAGFVPPSIQEAEMTGSEAEKYKDFSSEDKSSNFDESLEHNLPDNPFAPPKTCAESEPGQLISSPATNNNLIPGSSFSSLDMSPYKSCYFQAPRFASGHETIGM